MLLASSTVLSKEINGFELDDALIPINQIFSGGPAKDGIPSIDFPKFVKARDQSWMKDADRVLGITINDVSKAYPINILNWHEVVNDSINDDYFTITYCPLCGTGMAFASKIDGRVHKFGVSGLLYNSDVLLYDRRTESLWSQLLSKSVTGKYKGKQLKKIPLQHTTWADWKRSHPASLVLSKYTGFNRDYNKDPYGDYEQTERIYFPVFNKAPKKYHPKEKVLGLEIDNTYKAYPFIELNKNKKNRFTEMINNRSYTIHWNSKEQSGYITDDTGQLIPSVQSYWFAWYAFHPETDVFTHR